ncbi:MAG: ACP S-malonyltransferase [Planctomycetota bacterium]
MVQRVMLCPGQGAQSVGMGRNWYDGSDEARAVFDRADEVVGDRLGRPLTELCFEGPAETLNRTDAAQPALYVAGVASYRGLLAEWGAGSSRAGAGGEAGVVAAAGLSLGEYTAMHVAGAISFEDGLEMVLLRGRAMQDAAQATPSGMVALIGADEQQADAVVEQARGDDVLVAANFNAPGQIVLSGSMAAVDRADGVAGELGLRATKLAVAGAFHSPLMQPAADAVKTRLDEMPLTPTECRVYANLTGGAHDADADGVRSRLVGQLTGAVRWAECVRSVVKDFPDAELHELAPGKTLAGLARRIDRSLKVQPHDAPAA